MVQPRSNGFITLRVSECARITSYLLIDLVNGLMFLFLLRNTNTRCCLLMTLSVLWCDNNTVIKNPIKSETQDTSLFIVCFCPKFITWNYKYSARSTQIMVLTSSLSVLVIENLHSVSSLTQQSMFVAFLHTFHSLICCSL